MSEQQQVVSKVLADAVAKVNQEMDRIDEAEKNILGHYMSAGDGIEAAIDEAGYKATHKRLEKWYGETFPGRSIRTLQYARLLAKHRAAVEASGAKTVRDAIKALSAPKKQKAAPVQPPATVGTSSAAPQVEPTPGAEAASVADNGPHDGGQEPDADEEPLTEQAAEAASAMANAMEEQIERFYIPLSTVRETPQDRRPGLAAKLRRLRDQIDAALAEIESKPVPPIEMADRPIEPGDIVIPAPVTPEPEAPVSDPVEPITLPLPKREKGKGGK